MSKIKHGTYRCRICRNINDNKEDSDLCSSCAAEEREVLREAEWDAQREERLLERDNNAKRP